MPDFQTGDLEHIPNAYLNTLPALENIPALEHSASEYTPSLKHISDLEHTYFRTHLFQNSTLDMERTPALEHNTF